MASPFVIEDHSFEGQHIREYAAALADSQEDAVWLHAKSYTPHEVVKNHERGDLTIIGFHANGFPKEVYEPFFEILYERLKTQGLTVGSIWIADSASQGTSAVMNDEKLGNDAHWFDHSRDVLQMINTFRKHMRRPLVAVGHSMGGTQAVAAAHYHPRLFESVVLLDPPMTFTFAHTIAGMMQFVLNKPEKFRSRAEVVKFVRKHPFFRAWKPEVLQRYMDSSFHSNPTVQHSDEAVKPTTPNASEARGLGRMVAEPVDWSELTHIQRHDYPDAHTDSPLLGPIYNPHTRDGYMFLKTLRPRALFVLAQNSRICPPNELEDRTRITGTGPGGSGGVETGNVASVTVPGGHFFPMTNPEGSAQSIAEWLKNSLSKWRQTEDTFQQHWQARSKAEKQRLQPGTVETLKKWDGKPWHNPLAEPDGGRSKL